jgi:hypothetical protein
MLVKRIFFLIGFLAISSFTNAQGILKFECVTDCSIPR